MAAPSPARCARAKGETYSMRMPRPRQLLGRGGQQIGPPHDAELAADERIEELRLDAPEMRPHQAQLLLLPGQHLGRRLVGLLHHHQQREIEGLADRLAALIFQLQTQADIATGSAAAHSGGAHFSSSPP